MTIALMPSRRPSYNHALMEMLPAAFWPLGDGGNKANDLGPHGIEGFYSGGFKHEEPGPMASESRATLFSDGGRMTTSDYSLLSGKTAASVAFWLRHSGSVSANGSIVSRFDAGPFDGPVVFVDRVGAWTGNVNTITFLGRIQGFGGRIEGPTDLITPGEWQHIVCTFQGGVYFRLYCQGNLVAENTSNITPDLVDSQKPTQIASGDILGSLSGVLASIAIFDRALRSDECKFLYLAANGVL
jgi:hypothetical protein